MGRKSFIASHHIACFCQMLHAFCAALHYIAEAVAIWTGPMPSHRKQTESVTELSARWDTLRYSFQKWDITVRRDGLGCHEIGEIQMVIQLHRTTRATPIKVRDETSQTRSRRFEKGKKKAGGRGGDCGRKTDRQTDTQTL